ncbi:hypothetical protein BT96DRAFT_856133 [Gymnopus androsaceus JB14]|uniref:Uncharacterized protein n=1 Tax=Gymnopus androsaceus JB14 TaxID=1447944 RepID=A0A6A4HY58_9AGAR|nr:hypothetical protein BT96DRAFT_856133 [Gymnopus androsaceus JB14]
MSSPSLKPQSEGLVIIQRGSTESSPVSRALFILFRALDLPLQYAILSSRSLGAPLINALGGTAILPPAGGHVYSLGLETNTGVGLGLSPQRAILFGMAVGTFLRQSHWVVAISQEPMTPVAAGIVSVVETVYNSLNMLLYTNAATSVLSYAATHGDETRLPIQTLVGVALYVLGMAIEWGSEMQRMNFKRDARNKDRVYTRGLFGLARHINYGGYVLWRAGFATAAAGWVWGLVVGGFLTFDFVKRAIPELDEYCGKTYAQAWTQYKRAVPYQLFPFVL